jgi:hypothetical protein
LSKHRWRGPRIRPGRGTGRAPRRSPRCNDQRLRRLRLCTRHPRCSHCRRYTQRRLACWGSSKSPSRGRCTHQLRDTGRAACRSPQRSDRCPRRVRSRRRRPPCSRCHRRMSCRQLCSGSCTSRFPGCTPLRHGTGQKQRMLRDWRRRTPPFGSYPLEYTHCRRCMTRRRPCSDSSTFLCPDRKFPGHGRRPRPCRRRGSCPCMSRPGRRPTVCRRSRRCRSSRPPCSDSSMPPSPDRSSQQDDTGRSPSR